MDGITAPPVSFETVSDSTDWLCTPLSGLAAVEAGLRCQVCKDFYKTPMLTSCNHTFCSICIRRALANDGKCPLCRASEQEVKLRSNWSMEEVVAAFTKTRPDVLNFAQRPAVTTAEAETPKRKADDVDEDIEPTSQHISKRARSSARLSKTRSMEATAEMARQEAHLLDNEPNIPEPFEPDDGLVGCPICWQRMKAFQVDKHLDTNCPGQPVPQPQPPRATSRGKSTPSAFPGPSASSPKPPPKPERLPALNYSMLKEVALRKKMNELGISSFGPRATLEKRHKEWITIWNANCDALHPRRKAELLHDLDTWERTLGSRAPTGGRGANTGAQIRDKDFDGAAWASQHGDSFRDLIASARKTRGAAKQPSSEGAVTPTGEKDEQTHEGHETIPSLPPRQSSSTTQAPSSAPVTLEMTEVVQPVQPSSHSPFHPTSTMWNTPNHTSDQGPYANHHSANYHSEIRPSIHQPTIHHQSVVHHEPAIRHQPAVLHQPMAHDQPMSQQSTINQPAIIDLTETSLPVQPNGHANNASVDGGIAWSPGGIMKFS
ncbi:hypothetical protein F5Y15DRAFT_53279 [Xylariaceae sp. FL0016]|nr:hypothetical protein F5Y15DRAFT_53279 [Xylariaceae sp. FL0016]